MKHGVLNNRLLNQVATIESKIASNHDARGRTMSAEDMANLNARMTFSPQQHKALTTILAGSNYFTTAENSLATGWMGSNAATINAKSLAVRVLMLITLKNFQALALRRAA